ncbi:FeoA family protein [Paludisphaera mucosa]|uniref:FeoA domain-containing protein n=1 Tax=Paludisphaera mucosa TaxID=3030827 RepID=A0ABT6F582_9BACT|nr:FeoA domain-containing protein [Paludisphaera mucosa]MDG3002733.1 FeoA domain-containing protein [Paludisphaera mucosa]
MQAQALAGQGEETGEMVPLGLLRAGQSGSVGEVVGNLELVHRLREMGLYHGATVRMIRPGSPCIIGLEGQRLGFRGDDLARVLVRVPAMAS